MPKREGLPNPTQGDFQKGKPGLKHPADSKSQFCVSAPEEEFVKMSIAEQVRKSCKIGKSSKESTHDFCRKYTTGYKKFIKQLSNRLVICHKLIKNMATQNWGLPAVQ